MPMANLPELQSLRELIISAYPRELLERQLREFSCKRDIDVETFMHSKAIDYEISGLSRTYLYQLDNALPGDTLDIVAYFSVALTSVNFSGLSENRRRKVLGQTPGRSSQDNFAGLLIAQLARSDRYDTSTISGERMIGDCEAVIEIGRNYLGGKVAYLDCREPLIAYYERYGYRLVSERASVSGLYKMFKVLPKLAQDNQHVS
jgi:hypothetical protein